VFCGGVHSGETTSEDLKIGARIHSVVVLYLKT